MRVHTGVVSARAAYDISHMQPPANTAGALARYVEPVDPYVPIELVRDRFSAEQDLYAIPVVTAAGEPIGVLNRFKVFERLATRPAALGTHGAVSLHMEPSPSMFDEAMPLDALGARLNTLDSRHVFDGFVVTRGHRYFGIGTGVDLMRALAAQRHAELMKLAHHDPLTGLPNRHQFEIRLSDAITAGLDSSARTAVLFVDLDRFKQINDTFGHRVGDLVLCTVGQQLQSAVRWSDTVARLSGDEFAIVLTDVPDPSSAEAIANSILTACARPVRIEDHEIVVSCSIGLAVHPLDSGTVDGLMRAADAAAYHAKHVRNSCQRYRTVMATSPRRPRLTFSLLRQAIDRGQLNVHYQQQVDLTSGRICGVEALVRWSDPDFRSIPTDEMVRLAEDTGMIVPMTEVVVRTAMLDLLSWSAKTGRDDLQLSINVSAVQIHEGSLLTMLDRLSAETSVPPSRLQIELTESAAMLSANSSMELLRVLKEKGYTLAVDDFGTGYSSLHRLERLPVDIIKIDRSFVAGIGKDGRPGAVARAIIALGHALSFRLVAEGVETAEQLACLKEERCDMAQGYLFGLPMSATDMMACLTADATNVRS